MALEKRSSETALMPPPPAPKRIKRPPKVLDEATYTSALSHIIARDFFPSLLESEAQDYYLDALRSGDEDWIDEAGRRVQTAMTPVASSSTAGARTPVRRGERRERGYETPVSRAGETPRGGVGDETPRAVGNQRAQSQPAKSEQEDVDLSLSLNEFQARYTSEDNESFNTVLDKQNLQRREKYGWIWNKNKLPSKQQIAQAAVAQARERRLLAAGGGVDQSQNGALILAKDAATSRDDRPAMIDAARKERDPRNQLMFLPEDLETKYPEHKSQAQMAQDSSKAGPKAVAHANTRFPTEAPIDSSSIPPSPSISAIDAAIRGKSHPSLMKGGAYADSAAPDSSIDAGAETPRVNGYAFVEEDPTQAELDAIQGPPRGSTSERDRPDHAAILRAIKQSHGSDGTEESSVSPFVMAPSSKRETLHHALVDKNSRSKRSSNGSTPATPVARSDRLAALKALGRTPTPRFMSSPKVTSGAHGSAALTPAAKALYEKIGRTPRTGGASFGDQTPVEGRSGRTLRPPKKPS